MVQISGLGSVQTMSTAGWLVIEAHALSKARTAKRIDSKIFCFMKRLLFFNLAIRRYQFDSLLLSVQRYGRTGLIIRTGRFSINHIL